MADRSLPFRRLKQILSTFGVAFDARKGKGSHGTFFKFMDSGYASFTIPHRKDVLLPYVRACRKKFRLTEADGVNDTDFYNA
jgi:hypothetical protein